ncbi:AMP-binding protein [Actinoplanes sp. NPDC051861]|uniref:AMP-binding protein n=1 Tax=Actinoplanes sp. NPDC051861 TaxID=3155170 RepID=UPI00343872B1
MPTLLNDQVAQDGHAIAMLDADGAVTWRELGARVNRWMDVLTRTGVRNGDVIACLLGNRRETFEVLLAGLHLGVTVVPVNWHLTAPEIAYILADSGSRVLVTEPAYASTAAAAGGPVRLVLGDHALDGFTPAGPLLASADPAERAGQICGSIMLYTSGTTGRPKGVVNNMFAHGAPFDRVDRLIDYARVVLGVPAHGRVLLDGPWYHSAQLFFALLALLQSSRLVIRPYFDPVATLDVIDSQRITAVHLVPTQLVRLLRVDRASRAAFSGAGLERVWHGGGACPEAVKRAMIEWWGPVLTEYYGATEGGVVTLIGSTEWLRRPGSVGRAVPPSELLILGEDGAELPPGHTGRIFIRRRSGRRFRYHNDPAKTRGAYHAPDTFTYGEVGHVDEQGYLYLTGRAQDMIVTGGVNVYPAEVEAVLLSHPHVRDAAVVGVGDDEFGERVVAVVVAGEEAGDDLPERLDEYLRESLAGFKVPRDYHLAGSLPRDENGKLRKRELRERYAPAVAVAGERVPR